MLQFRVISIGTLGAHPLWNEKGAVREAHSTTTLIESGNRKIIVDPSLPPQILQPRMHSRTGVKCEEITDVFLTSKNPGQYRGITLFPGDIIATGTPAGVGMGLKPPRYLKTGDVVRVEIDGIGHIENKFV